MKPIAGLVLALIALGIAFVWAMSRPFPQAF
jgi:hypothetical protein